MIVQQLNQRIDKDPSKHSLLIRLGISRYKRSGTRARVLCFSVRIPCNANQPASEAARDTDGYVNDAGQVTHYLCKPLAHITCNAILGTDEIQKDVNLDPRCHDCNAVLQSPSKSCSAINANLCSHLNQQPIGDLVTCLQWTGLKQANKQDP